MVRMVCVPQLNIFNQLVRFVDESSKLIVWVHAGYLFIEGLSIGLEPLPSLLRGFKKGFWPKISPVWHRCSRMYASLLESTIKKRYEKFS